MFRQINGKNMKNIYSLKFAALFAALFLFFVFTDKACANDFVKKLSDKYSNTQGFSVIRINKDMFDLMKESQIEKNVNPDKREYVNQAIEAMTDLNYVVVISHDKKSGVKEHENFIKELHATIPFSEYSELINVKTEDSKVRLLVKSQNKVITNLVLVVEEKKQVIFINIDGKLELKKMMQLIELMQSGEFEKFEDFFAPQSGAQKGK